MSITRKRSSKSPNTSSKSPTRKNNEYNNLTHDDHEAHFEYVDRTHIVDDLMIPSSSKFSHKTLPASIKIYKKIGNNNRTVKQIQENPFKRRNRRARKTEKREMKKANKEFRRLEREGVTFGGRKKRSTRSNL